MFFKGKNSAGQADSIGSIIFCEVFGKENVFSVVEDSKVNYYADWCIELWGIGSTKVETRCYIEANGK